jgi:hypothetical protein
MFFISLIPSEIRRFKFTVSWLCDDHIALKNLCRERFSTSRYDSALSVLSKDYIDDILIASRKLVDDSRMGTAIGPRSP